MRGMQTLIIGACIQGAVSALSPCVLVGQRPCTRLAAHSNPELAAAVSYRRSSLSSLRGGAGAAASELSDFKGEANGLFMQMRLVAIFPAGAILAQLFGMPPSPVDSFSLAMAKRIYLLVGVGSLSTGLSAVCFSTAALHQLSLLPPAPAASLNELLKRDYDFLHTGTVVNFVLCVLGLITMVGIRAFFWTHCSAFGRTAALILTSSLFLIVSILNSSIEAENSELFSVTRMVRHYIELLGQRVRKCQITLLALLILVGAAIYGAYGTLHVYQCKVLAKMAAL